MPADIAFVNGHIITMSEQKPAADAIAVKDGKIMAVGTRHEVEQSVDEETRTVDLKGKTVVPGLIDTHAHMISLRNPLPWVDLRNVISIKEIQRKLRAKAEETEKGEWILGRGWDQERLKERRYPTRWDLDKVSPQNPVLLTRVCGHIGVANSLALKIAGINGKSEASLGELIDKDQKTGQPTGILREKARDIVGDLPQLEEEDLVKACSSACADATRAGLTSVHWLVYNTSEIRALQKLKRLGQLPLRVYIIPHIEHFEAVKNKIPDSSNLKLKCIKILADGSLGARTAALLKPYTDDPSTKGLLNYGLDELKIMIKMADKAGFQIAVHVIGDLALTETLKAFSEALSSSDIRRRRHRLEHVSVLNPALIRRIKSLGLLVCVQPHFVVSDFWIAQRLGPARARWTYAFRSLMKNGVLVAGSSDAPAEPLSPILGIWAAVTRKSFPAERLSIEEALRLYTVNAAYFSFEESVKGSIEVDKLADFTVLSHNPLTMDPEKVKDIRIEMTIVGGKIVYSAAD